MPAKENPKQKKLPKFHPKKKLTRKAERKAQEALVELLRARLEADAHIMRILFNARKRAVEKYFGKALPEDLEELLDKAISVAVQDAQPEGKDVDLAPVVDEVVADFVAAESQLAPMQGDVVTP